MPPAAGASFWCRAATTLRQGARVIEDSQRARAWCVQSVRAPLASRNARAGGARDVKNSERTDLLSKNCSLNRDVECPSVGTIFAHSFSEPVSHGAPLYHWQEGGPEPYRPARRQPRAHAPPNACNEPGEARCRTRPQLPAGTEIREGRQPHRGQPIAATLPYPAGATRVLLRGRAQRISATRLL